VTVEHFDCVVNHFFRPGYPEKVRASAMLAASCLRAEPEVKTVVLVDGSTDADPALAAWCEAGGIRYLHLGRSLSFAEGYNSGLAFCDAPWTVFCASDIYIRPGFFAAALPQLQQLRRSGRLGCAIPHLSDSDWPMQSSSYRRLRRTPLMTLNLNIFERSCLERVGGFSTAYSGNYNDLDMALRLRELNLDIWLLPLLALHYGQMTVKSGSGVSLTTDRQRFAARHPELVLDRGFWDLRLAPFFEPGWRRRLLALESMLPARWRASVQRRLLQCL
jgi:GT2 family glycosyltransferase